MTEKKPEKINKELKERIDKLIRRTLRNADRLDNYRGARPFTYSSTANVLKTLPKNPAPAHPAYSDSGTTSAQLTSTKPPEAVSSTISTSQTVLPSNAEVSDTLAISAAQTVSLLNTEASASSTISTTQIASLSNAEVSTSSTISTAQRALPSSAEASASSIISTEKTASPSNPSNAEVSALSIISTAQQASPSNAEQASALSIISTEKTASPSNAEVSVSSTKSTAQPVSPFNAEASASSTCPTSPPPAYFKTCNRPKRNREPSPPPGLPPRRLGKSHRIEAPPPPSRRRKYCEKRPISLTIPKFSDSELELSVAMELLLDIPEAQDQLNKYAADWLQCMEFPDGIPESPPPPYISDEENVKKSELEEVLKPEEVSKPEKEKECIICKRFERLSLQKDEVHLSWLLCKFYITSHMHNLCTWDAGPEKPKSEFWLSSEHQRSRQMFEQQVKSYLNEFDMIGLSTVVNNYLESFKQLLFSHTPKDQVDHEEKCEEQLEELQTGFLKLLSTRADVLEYLLKEKEGFRHDQCPSYDTSMEWIKECTNEISEGLREFEINLENLHLGRLIWSQ